MYKNFNWGQAFKSSLSKIAYLMLTVVVVYLLAEVADFLYKQGVVSFKLAIISVAICVAIAVFAGIGFLFLAVVEYLEPPFRMIIYPFMDSVLVKARGLPGFTKIMIISSFAMFLFLKMNRLYSADIAVVVVFTISFSRVFYVTQADKETR